MANIGPVVFSVVGEEWPFPARIAGGVWDGATSAGDSIEIRCRETGALLLPLRTNDTNTFVGAMVPPEGIHAPFGFRAAILDSGRVSIYLREG